MEYDISKFNDGLNKLGISLDDSQIDQFIKYYNLLVETNKVMNLTAITAFDEVIEKHFIDSLAIVNVADLNNQLSVIDVGTGAGFPGIPLKIAFPDLHIVLADSLNKRIKFLNNVIDELSLDGISAVHGRAEDLAKNDIYRGKFDIVVSRAVANLSSLSEYCLPFVKKGGTFISYKSGEVDEETDKARSAIKILGGEVRDVYKFDLNGQGRSFVIIDKKKNTPKAYPRKAGLPSKEPLGK